MTVLLSGRDGCRLHGTSSGAGAGDRVGRDPDDRDLRELVGELSTVSEEFRTRWAAHDVRVHHAGVKRFRHPAVGDLELTYHTFDVPTPDHAKLAPTVCTAEPGTPSEDALRLLASWAATAGQEQPLGAGSDRG